MNTILFIGGPPPWVPEHQNFYDAAEAYLRKKYPNTEIINPADENNTHYPQDPTCEMFSDEEWTQWWLVTLLSGVDHIFMLSGWTLSDHGSLQYRVADSVGLGLTVLSYDTLFCKDLHPGTVVHHPLHGYGIVVQDETCVLGVGVVYTRPDLNGYLEDLEPIGWTHTLEYN